MSILNTEMKDVMSKGGVLFDVAEKVEYKRDLSSEEIENILQNGGFSNIQDVTSKVYGKQNKQIDKSRYYAEAIISQYDWSQIGIEEFKVSERNELIKRLQDKNCVDIYEKLIQIGVETKQIPTVLLNIATRQGFYEEYEKGNLKLGILYSFCCGTDVRDHYICRTAYARGRKIHDEHFKRWRQSDR